MGTGLLSRASASRAVPTVMPSAGGSGGNRMNRNLEFLRSAYRKYMVLSNASGAGFSQNYVPGTQLIWDVPKIQGGYLEEILIKCAITINPATGTGATYALNAGAPYNLFDYLIVEINKQQVRIPPVVLKWLAQLSGYEKSQPEQVNTGQTVSFVGNTVWGSPFALTVSTNNPWNFWFRLPLRMLPRHVAGMIPIGPDSPKIQVKLNCCSAGLDGVDPIANPVWGQNTGHAVTSGGTVIAEGIYRDGSTYRSIQPVTPDLSGEPTIQWFTDRVFNPLAGGVLQKMSIDTKLQHLYGFLVVVDGVQNNKFAADSNFAAIEFLKDAGGDAAFWKFGTQGNNVGTTEFFAQFRERIGQDLDEGVIPFIPGPAWMAEPDPDNLDGLNALEMTGDYGYYDAQMQLQMTTIGGGPAGIVPRMQYYLVSLNKAGLVAVQ